MLVFNKMAGGYLVGHVIGMDISYFVASARNVPCGLLFQKYWVDNFYFRLKVIVWPLNVIHIHMVTCNVHNPVRRLQTSLVFKVHSNIDSAADSRPLNSFYAQQAFVHNLDEKLQIRPECKPTVSSHNHNGFQPFPVGVFYWNLNKMISQYKYSDDASKHHFASLKNGLISWNLVVLEQINSWNCLKNNTIFFHLSPTSSHLYPLQVENCDSNSRLVVDENDNGKLINEMHVNV